MSRQIQAIAMPIKSLYCARCRAADKPSGRVTWLDVEVLDGVENAFSVLVGARCKCRNCGHCWASRSKAGRRAARNLAGSVQPIQQG